MRRSAPLSERPSASLPDRSARTSQSKPAALSYWEEITSSSTGHHSRKNLLATPTRPTTRTPQTVWPPPSLSTRLQSDPGVCFQLEPHTQKPKTLSTTQTKPYVPLELHCHTHFLRRSTESSAPSTSCRKMLRELQSSFSQQSPTGRQLTRSLSDPGGLFNSSARAVHASQSILNESFRASVPTDSTHKLSAHASPCGQTKRCNSAPTHAVRNCSKAAVTSHKLHKPFELAYLPSAVLLTALILVVLPSHVCTLLLVALLIISCGAYLVQRPASCQAPVPAITAGVPTYQIAARTSPPPTSVICIKGSVPSESSKLRADSSQEDSCEVYSITGSSSSSSHGANGYGGSNGKRSHSSTALSAAVAELQIEVHTASAKLPASLLLLLPCPTMAGGGSCAHLWQHLADLRLHLRMLAQLNDAGEKLRHSSGGGACKPLF